MIKVFGKGRNGGRDVLILGLSFANLDKFREHPRDTFIRIDGKLFGLSADILLFSGETEQLLTDVVADLIGPSTKVDISDKLKS